MANFKSTSRYNRAVVTTNRSDQPFIILRSPISIEESANDIYVTLTQEHVKRPDIIAENAYGDPDLWWVIYEVNGIKDPVFELQIGQIIRIPPLEKVLEVLEADEE